MPRKPKNAPRAAVNTTIRAEMVGLTTGVNNVAVGYETLAPAKVEHVTNPHKGTQLHLGDGRVLEFGESAEVTAEVKAACIANGTGQ